ncbi:MAG: ACP phosphodiesterase [Motiliproteus sp.]|nr:ACP phosphodiesterase [Motiliproteus sp.]MCW9051063.1 ACP phosphodiesterase [Motiliproteus sp.]
MNYLAHLYFSEPSMESRVGNLMGDFVRGAIPCDRSQAIRRGIWLHRKIDAFTDQQAYFLRSKARFSADRRRYAGIILDVTYDHFLTQHWSTFSDSNLQHFIDQCYQELLQSADEMPEKMARVVRAMANQDWLSSYQQIEGVGFALDRMSQRFKRQTRLLGSGSELVQIYDDLESDFLQFFPVLMDYVAELKNSDIYLCAEF